MIFGTKHGKLSSSFKTTGRKKKRVLDKDRNARKLKVTLCQYQMLRIPVRYIGKSSIFKNYLKLIKSLVLEVI